MADAAYFIGGSLDIGVRRSHEEELLEHYRQCLGEEGG